MKAAFHKHLSENLRHQDLAATCIRKHPRPFARRILGKVQWSQNTRLALNELQHIALIKGVIAQRDAIGPGLKQPLGMFARKPHAIGGILAIDHHEIEPPIGAQSRQIFAHRPAPGTAHHIAKKEYFHRPSLGSGSTGGKGSADFESRLDLNRKRHRTGDKANLVDFMMK